MSVSPDYFEQLFSDSDDPWAFRTRWYEKRKRDLMLASLARQRYQRVFEPACANGEFSVVLAERSEWVLCQDITDKAVHLARQRVSHFPHVRVEQGRVPEDWPEGSFDLIVLSEFGYYLDSTDWQRVIENTVRSLSSEGGVLACHWLHPIEGCSQNGREVHQKLAEGLGLHRILCHEETNFLLEYWCRRQVTVDLAERCSD
ncbi:class I SAM-dependent methyltransferase [Pseudomonas sp. SDO55104_S430]